MTRPGSISRITVLSAKPSTGRSIRSKQTSEKLAAIGYTHIYEFGGINTWTGEIEKQSKSLKPTYTTESPDELDFCGLRGLFCLYSELRKERLHEAERPCEDLGFIRVAVLEDIKNVSAGG